MVKAPTIRTTAAHPLSNATLSSTGVAVETDVEVDVNVVGVSSSSSSNNLLTVDNASGGVAINSTVANNENNNKLNNETHSMTTALSAADGCPNSLSVSTSDPNAKINGNDIVSPNISSPTNEQSTQTDDDDNSSICSSTNSIRYLANEQGEGMEAEEETAAGKDTVDATLYLADNPRAVDEEMPVRDSDNQNANTPHQVDEQKETLQYDGDEEETYCVGHFYGQEEEDAVPEKPPDGNEDQMPKKDVIETDNSEEQSCNNNENLTKPDGGTTTSAPSDTKSSETIPTPTTALSVPSYNAKKSYTLAHPIPQIIGITGMLAQQQSVSGPPPPPPHLQQQQQQQQSTGGLLQPLHLATLGTHPGAGVVNQQISPTAAATSGGGSTSIQHHHHCVHHPHVHLHSPGGHPPSNAAGAAVATATAGHPHTHIFPLQVISLAQAPGTAAAAAAAAAAGAQTAWPLVEAPIYVDANGEYRTYCPAHPQGPPPREHRVLLQLDAGVSLPLQIAGKRKVFRGEFGRRFPYPL